MRNGIFAREAGAASVGYTNGGSIDSTFARRDTHVANHLVLLSHDRMFQRPSDADSLAKLIHILKQNPDYVFETVDHYPGLKKPVHRGSNLSSMVIVNRDSTHD
jgi:hypothetical protein